MQRLASDEQGPAPVESASCNLESVSRVSGGGDRRCSIAAGKQEQGRAAQRRRRGPQVTIARLVLELRQEFVGGLELADRDEYLDAIGHRVLRLLCTNEPYPHWFGRQHRLEGGISVFIGTALIVIGVALVVVGFTAAFS
jgi:hypothetical protein